LSEFKFGKSGLSESGLSDTKFFRFLKKKRFMSLNVKLALVVLLAVILTVVTYGLLALFEDATTNKIFLSQYAKERTVDDRYQDLENLIKEDHVKGTNSGALKRWMKDESYTEIVISDGKKDIFSAGGWVASTGSTAGPMGSTTEPKERNLRKDLTKEKEDLYNRKVKFADRTYNVFINVYREYQWQMIMGIVEIVASAVVFLLTLLFYSKSMTNRIIRLSDVVQRVSGGELKAEITVSHNDEIANLAKNVDLMRNSILEKMDSEKAAQEANAELITSMSHDIRTPLTSLIGYLDIIRGGKYNSQEELDSFINSSVEKALQLKDLSDKLFQYFLVFSSEERERDMEILDGGILFQQLLAEHISEVITYGYKVNLQYSVPEGVLVNTEISAMQRLFDNLFSNIMKYANTEFQVEIKADLLPDRSRIKIVMQNHISEDARKVESNKIGVKTCKKICEDLDAGFHVMEEEKIYTTEIIYPCLTEEETKTFYQEQEEAEKAEKERASQEVKQEFQTEDSILQEETPSDTVSPDADASTISDAPGGADGSDRDAPKAADIPASTASRDTLTDIYKEKPKLDKVKLITIREDGVRIDHGHANEDSGENEEN
jgi:signal transduction histidine kinase